MLSKCIKFIIEMGLNFVIIKAIPKKICRFQFIKLILLRFLSFRGNGFSFKLKKRRELTELYKRNTNIDRINHSWKDPTSMEKSFKTDLVYWKRYLNEIKISYRLKFQRYARNSTQKRLRQPQFHKHFVNWLNGWKKSILVKRTSLICKMRSVEKQAWYWI